MEEAEWQNWQSWVVLELVCLQQKCALSQRLFEELLQDGKGDNQGTQMTKRKEPGRNDRDPWCFGLLALEPSGSQAQSGEEEVQ